MEIRISTVIIHLDEVGESTFLNRSDFEQVEIDKIDEVIRIVNDKIESKQSDK